MAGDWLQGPYIYAIYKSYGFELNEIAILFVTGFLSSGIFGTIIGSAADKLILGGISTSLLFSVFEAWMVSEHFSRATFGNGLVAIFSGLFANWLVERHGISSPFLAAIGFFVTAAMVIILTWKENYGSDSKNVPCFHVMNYSRVLAIGAVQSLYEASMYIFVFLWAPLLESQHDISNESNLPFVTCGLYFPLIGTLRAKAISEDIRATVGNLFRISDISILEQCLLCSFLLFIAFIWSFWLPMESSSSKKSAKTVAKIAKIKKTLEKQRSD
ncbi:15665_t:CDS:2 [Gigaspora rosea]|nr:15665_t:CDS:2 [Gigaspora rosea]